MNCVRRDIQRSHFLQESLCAGARSKSKAISQQSLGGVGFISVARPVMIGQERQKSFFIAKKKPPADAEGCLNSKTYYAD